MLSYPLFILSYHFLRLVLRLVQFISLILKHQRGCCGCLVFYLEEGEREQFMEAMGNRGGRAQGNSVRGQLFYFFPFPFFFLLFCFFFSGLLNQGPFEVRCLSAFSPELAEQKCVCAYMANPP